MLFLALPDVAPLPMYETSSVLLAAAPQAQSPKITTRQAVRSMVYGVCTFPIQHNMDYADHIDRGAGWSLSPSDYMRDFLSVSMQDKIFNSCEVCYPSEQDWFWEWRNSFKITVLRSPSHGAIIAENAYLPNKGYVGKDRVDIRVEGKDDAGRPIALTLRYHINVVTDESFLKIVDEKEDNYSKALRQYCGTNKGYWRISRVDGNNLSASWLDGSLTTASASNASVLATWQKTADLSGP